MKKTIDKTVSYSFSQHIEVVKKIMPTIKNGNELDTVIDAFDKAGEEIFGKKEYGELMTALALSTLTEMIEKKVNGEKK